MDPFCGDEVGGTPVSSVHCTQFLSTSEDTDRKFMSFRSTLKVYSKCVVGMLFPFGCKGCEIISKSISQAAKQPSKFCKISSRRLDFMNI